MHARRKTFLGLIGVLAAVFALWFVSRPPSRWQRVTPGMSRSEVYSLIGQPFTSNESTKGGVRWRSSRLIFQMAGDYFVLRTKGQSIDAIEQSIYDRYGLGVAKPTSVVIRSTMPLGVFMQPDSIQMDMFVMREVVYNVLCARGVFKSCRGEMTQRNSIDRSSAFGEFHLEVLRILAATPATVTPHPVFHEWKMIFMETAPEILRRSGVLNG